MSEENVEIVRRVIDAWNRRDIDELVTCTDPETEYVNHPKAVEPGTRRGIAEVSAVWRSQWEFGNGRFDAVERIFDRGDEVFVLCRMSAAIARSDSRIEESVLLSWRLRGGKMIRFEVLGLGRTEIQTALEAAGLSE